MLRWLALAFILLGGMVSAAEDIQQQMHRVDAALTRISQEQQALYQQFQMVQELRRNDERQMLQLQTYAPTTPPNYDDVKRGEEARAQRVRQHQYELERLYARYRELEEQNKPLLEMLSVLAQQRFEVEAAARATSEQREPTIGR